MRWLLILIMLPVFVFAAGCRGDEEKMDKNDNADARYGVQRYNMVSKQIAARGVKDERVIEAMMETPRHEFVPEAQKPFAYDDRPLPIGYEQTISQPYIVALMTESVRIEPDDKVLEIGTGSGYQAAVLSKLATDVYTIEIVEPLGIRAEKDLKRLGYDNVYVRVGDGFKGWPDQAPFDAIIVTCAPPEIPPPLLEQLAEGGRLVIPVGDTYPQELVLAEKKNGKIRRKNIISVLFVPMTGDGVKSLE